MTRVNSTEAFGMTPYQVSGSIPSLGAYTTIQSAINQAVTDGASYTNPKYILIQPGTYTENLTMYNGISLITYTKNDAYIVGSAFSFTENVVLDGTVTFSEPSPTSHIYMTFQGIEFNPSSGVPFTLSVNQNPVGNNQIYFNNCSIAVNSASSNGFSAYGRWTLVFVGCDVDDGSGSSNFINFAGDDTGSQSIYVTMEDSVVSFNTWNVASSSIANVTLKNSDWYTSIVYSSASSSSCVFNANYSNIPISGSLIDSGTNIFDVSFFSCLLTGTPIAPGSINSSNVFVAYQSTFNTVSDITQLYFGSDNAIRVISNCNVSDSTPLFYEIFKGIETGFTGSQLLTTQSGIQTTNSSATTIASVLVNQLESVTIEGTITGAQSDHTNAVGGNFIVTAHRASGGNVTIAGSVVKNVNSSSAATFNCVANTGTQSIDIQVTGVAATTYNWVTTFSYQKVLTNS